MNVVISIVFLPGSFLFGVMIFVSYFIDFDFCTVYGTFEFSFLCWLMFFETDFKLFGIRSLTRSLIWIKLRFNSIETIPCLHTFYSSTPFRSAFHSNCLQFRIQRLFNASQLISSSAIIVDLSLEAFSNVFNLRWHCWIVEFNFRQR